MKKKKNYRFGNETQRTKKGRGSWTTAGSRRGRSSWPAAGWRRGWTIRYPTFFFPPADCPADGHYRGHGQRQGSPALRRRFAGKRWRTPESADRCRTGWVHQLHGAGRGQAPGGKDSPCCNFVCLSSFILILLNAGSKLFLSVQEKFKFHFLEVGPRLFPCRAIPVCCFLERSVALRGIFGPIILYCAFRTIADFNAQILQSWTICPYYDYTYSKSIWNGQYA